METFEGRLRFQKTIYLMQSFDLYIGYDFSWYIRGPYSTELTRDGYALRSHYEDIPEARFEDSEAESRFNRFLQFINGHVYDANWLEIIASIHYLKRRDPHNSKNNILETVQNKQSYFTFAQCLGAWDYLKEWRMLNENH